MKNKSVFSVCILLSVCVVGFVGCSNQIQPQNRSAPKHLLKWAVTDEMLTDFTDEEEKSILEAFNVVIPENEDAHVHSFYFSENDRNSTSSHFDFILEIEGVKDYEFFFGANTTRISENGLSGKSWNEIVEDYPPEYYVTYFETFSTDPKAQAEEHKQMISALKPLYEELAMKRHSETLQSTEN